MDRIRLLLTVAGVGAIAATGAAAPAAPAALKPISQLTLRPAGERGPLGDERLSDEWQVTRIANANYRARIRTAPRRSAHTITSLRFQTEDGPPEVYIALRSHVDSKGRSWIQVRIPMRPNGRKGWVPEDALSAFRVVRTSLRINRTTLRATLYRDGRKVWQSPIGVGKASTPTPAGHFWIRTRLRNLAGGGVYGPWAFGTAAYSILSDWPGGGVVGIHGTNEPQLIPGRPSHGCIRVPNPKILKLVKLMPVGTPVDIV